MTSRFLFTITLFATLFSGLALGQEQSATQPPPAMVPLELGNQWIYETADGRYSFTMSVGIPEMHGDRAYFSVRGYGYGSKLGKLLVRQGDDGALYTFDDVSGQDVLLTLFEHVPGGWFQSRLGPCDETGQALPQPVVWNFGSESKAAATAIRYRNFDCADFGLEEEIYAENLGLVRRRLTTVMGPLEFNLVYARVGRLVYRTGATSSLSLDLDRSHVARVPGEYEPPVRIKLRYVVEPLTGGTLRFRSGQVYDVFLVDSNGNEVWRWSDTEAYIQPIVEIPHSGFLEFEAYLPAHKFADGNYMIYGWLNTDSQKQPSVGIPFQISNIQPAAIGQPAPDAQ